MFICSSIGIVRLYSIKVLSRLLCIINGVCLVKGPHSMDSISFRTNKETACSFSKTHECLSIVLSDVKLGSINKEVLRNMKLQEIWLIKNVVRVFLLMDDIVEWWFLWVSEEITKFLCSDVSLLGEDLFSIIIFIFCLRFNFHINLSIVVYKACCKCQLVKLGVAISWFKLEDKLGVIFLFTSSCHSVGKAWTHIGIFWGVSKSDHGNIFEFEGETNRNDKREVLLIFVVAVFNRVRVEVFVKVAGKVSCQ